ncbi:MAG: nucleotidyltransferase [Bacteroidetes bacterium]|nr:nucleotidyltransferase [Bacteroidota bacterium]MCL5738427.1 nucleotidyltransferase [Bacteroidota bacterium]
MKTEDLFQRFLEVIDALEKEKVDYLLVGGFAVVLHGMPRLTQDLDLFVKANGDNIARLQKALYSVFDDKSIFEITNTELQNYPVIRYGSDEGFSIDVISRIGESFAFEDLQYEELNVDGHTVKIATAETLYRLKEKTYRAIDQNDLIFLKELISRKK